MLMMTYRQVVQHGRLRNEGSVQNPSCRILFTCFYETKYLFKMHDSQRIFFTKPFPYFVSGYTKHGYFTLSEPFVQHGHQEGALSMNNSALTMHFFGALKCTKVFSSISVHFF